MKAGDLAREKLRSSGLEKYQSKLQIDVTSDASRWSTSFYPVAAMKLPYFTWRGGRTSFYRIRYLERPTGFSGLTAKPQRYAQLPNTLNEVYTPPLAPWPKIISMANVPIYITEGELKAACGCAQGLAVLGLGGVDVWRSGKKGLALLPQLEQIVWKHRNVYVVFDSDSATNDNVLKAQLRLCAALTARGATPMIVSLPKLPKMDKTGLDDFLVKKGKEALEELALEAEPFGEAEALWEVNSEIVYVKDPGLIVQRKDGLRSTPSAFKEHGYSNRHYFETKVTDEGTKMIKKPIAPRWLQWEHRFELLKCDYAPGEPQITDRSTWNYWRGWGSAAKHGNVKPWHQLLDFLFEGRAKDRLWFERWCAYPLQHPGAKMFTACVMWGATQGTGKSLVGYSLMRIYGENGTEIKEGDLKGSFNEWAQNRQFVMGDDVTGDDSRAYADQLKTVISQQRIRINTKFIPSYEVPDCINYYFTSNHPDAFFLDDSDRRFFIHETPNYTLSREFYEAYDKWYKSAEGTAALFAYLLDLDLGTFNPREHAPETQAKRAMITDNKSDVGMFCVRLREDPTAVIRVISDGAAKQCALATPEQLLRCYDPEHATKVTVNGLSRELKRTGFRQANGGIPVRTELGLQRFYIVRDPQRWNRAKPEDLAKHWLSFFGPKASKY